jgi:hypothetical protein
MARQRENDVWSSVSFAYIAAKYDVTFKASLIIAFLIDNLIFTILFYVSQPGNTFKK